MQNPSLSDSPWMRGAPEVGFSATMREISLRTSLLICFTSDRLLSREIQLQYSRRPLRCQRITVSGVTRINDLLQPGQITKSPARSLCMQRQQLSPMGEVLHEEFYAGAKDRDERAEQMLKAHKHQQIIAKSAPGSAPPSH